MSLEEILAQTPEGGQIGLTLVTNQDNGIVGYATGTAYHYGGFSLVGPIRRSPRVSTTGGEPLKFYFSDRILDIDPPLPQGSFGRIPRQPFSANAMDKLGVSISILAGVPRVVKFTLISWGNATFSISMEKRGDLLVGIGPAIGNQTDHAVYLLSFHKLAGPPR